MTIRIRRWMLVCASISVIFLVFATIWYELTFYQRAYAWLTPGASKAEVLKRFGNPGNIGACLSTPSWDGDPMDNSSMPCVEEFLHWRMDYRVRQRWEGGSKGLFVVTLVNLCV
jgi:hypothetical protein